MTECVSAKLFQPSFPKVAKVRKEMLTAEYCRQVVWMAFKGLPETSLPINACLQLIAIKSINLLNLIKIGQKKF